mgnify:FL=1
MAIRVALISQKGGCGKSTMAQMISREFAAADWDVKIADFDVRQGTTTYWKQLREQNKQSPVIAVEPVGTVQQAMKSDPVCDLLLFDGPAKASKLVEEIAKASDLIVLPTSVGEADLRPAVLLAHELKKMNIPVSKIIFALNRAGTDAENDQARAYIQEAGYEIAEGELPERSGYRQAYQQGRAPTEAQFKTLREKAAIVARSIAKKIEALGKE